MFWPLKYKIDILRISTIVKISKTKSSTLYGTVLHFYKRILYYLQTYYAQNVLMNVIIQVCFLYALQMYSNSLRMIKIDRNTSGLWNFYVKM